MATEREHVTALRELRARLAQQFDAKVRDGATPLAELRDMQERLRLVDAAIANPEQIAQRRRRAVWIALLVVAALLSLGALIPMPRVPFSLEAEASAVRLRVAGAGELGLQAVPGELVVDGYTALESPDVALMQQAGAQGSGRVAIEAASLNLRRIAHAGAATIDALAGAQSASLTIHGERSPVTVEVEFAGRTTVRFGQTGERRTADFPFAEWLHLRAGDPDAAQRVPPPVTVSLARGAQTDYAWTTLRPTEVRFVERALVAGNETAVVSSLRSARLRLQASADELLLGAGDELDLAGLELQHCELVLGPVVRLRMSGAAGSLLTRTGHFERSLKPSLLEYAARHKRVELLWSAALLLWGATRWLQRLAGGEA